jgi:hypothetical protein
MLDRESSRERGRLLFYPSFGDTHRAGAGVAASTSSIGHARWPHRCLRCDAIGVTPIRGPLRLHPLPGSIMTDCLALRIGLSTTA